MTFDYFCDSFELNPEERILCVFCLANFRYQQTVATLSVDHEQELLKHLASLRVAHLQEPTE